MTSPQKVKGDRFERDVVDYLRQNGFPYAERTLGAGRPDDRGDIDGLVSWTIECKNRKAFDLAGWSAEAAAEAVNARRHNWAVVVKRRNRPTSDAYVVLDLAAFAELVADDEVEVSPTTAAVHEHRKARGPRP